MRAKPAPQELGRAVGAFLRAWREEHGESLASLAGSSQQFGLNWKRTTIAEIEAGRRSVTFVEAVQLCCVLSWAGTRDISLGDLLPSEGTVMISDAVRADAKHLRDFTTGKDEGLGAYWPDMPAWTEDEPIGFVGVPKEGGEAYLMDREAERKVANKLGVSYDALMQAALKRWGQSLSKERDVRLTQKEEEDSQPIPKRRRQALLGHITRELTQELEESLTRTSKR